MRVQNGKFLPGAPIDLSAVADGLLIPNTSPTVAGSLGYSSNVLLQFNNGAINHTYATVDRNSNSLYNLGLKLNAGAISVTGFGNSALASSNAAFISYPSSTGGLWLTQLVTADQTIASGGIKGRWGTTASVAWGNDLPFAIGVTSKDDTASGIRFFICLNPNMTTTPASTNNIGIDGTAPVTSDQNNIVLFGSAATTGYNSRPCRIIGSFRMTCDASAGGVWTVTALDSGDGIGNFFNFMGREFQMVQGQQGNAAGKLMKDNVGVAPTFTATNIASFKIFMDGNVFFYWDLENTAGGTAGTTAVNSLIGLPYARKTAGNWACGSGWMTGNVIDTMVVTRILAGDLKAVQLAYQTTVKTLSATVQNADFNATTRNTIGSALYQAF